MGIGESEAPGGATGGRMETTERWYREWRPYLFSIAYRMLGSQADAEDVVQDVFLTLQNAGQAEAVQNPKHYLGRTVVNRCLNVLGSAARRREAYVGPWLPEPLIDASAPLPDEAAELGETVSYAFLVLLEKLAPLERAVFVLRETYGCGYAEIASLVDKSEANCRQIYSRAKRRLAREPVVPRRNATERERGLARRFVSAFGGGRMEELVRLLTEDAVVITDGGGKVHAAINPIYGRTRSLALLEAMAKRSMKGARLEEVPIPDGIGVAVWRDERLIAFMCFDWNGTDEPLRRVYAIYNPDKLESIQARLNQS